ncbi:MAG: BMP family ABC transporter substrate-binding protein [Eubacteriales bacterium]
MMKKLVSVLAITAMVASLSACGSTAEETTTEEVVVSEDAEEGTTEGTGLYDAIPVDEIIVGVIHITDPAEGSGYTYTHDQGIVGMQEALGLDDSQIIRKNNVDDSDATAIENAMLECIEEGANIIFATSWGYMDTCAALAEEYPDVIFSHGTGYSSNGTNFNNYFGRIYQARYLAGVAAGLNTETNKLGYVAAMGSDNSEVTGGVNAFAMGVYSVNPDAEVYVKVTNSWFDPEGETQAAEALLAMGCDVIAQHCDTSNPQTAAEKAGVYGIGYNSDMSKDAPDAVLTSVMWDWSVYYTYAVSSVIEGTWDGSNYFGSMTDGLVSIASLSDFCADGTQEAVDEAVAQFETGWDVFDGVIETNTGETVGTEGESMADSDITGAMNWYFKTVIAE